MCNNELMTKIKETVWNRTPGDVHLAERLISLLESTVRPVVTNGRVYAYDPQTGIWEEFNKLALRKLIQSFNDTYIKRHSEDTEKAKTRSTTRLNLSASKIRGAVDSIYGISDLIQEEDYFTKAEAGVNLLDGFLKVDGSGMTLVPHAAEHRATEMHPVRYQELFEQDPNFWLDSVLAETFSATPDKERAIMAWQEFMGACLIGKATNYARCLIFEGPGKNGKSVLCEVLAGLFNPRFVVHSDPASWSEPFALARLHGAKLNVAAELSLKKWDGDNVLKMMITGEQKDVREIYGSLFTMYPQAGHIFSTNHDIRSDDLTDAFFRRLLIIPLRKQFNNKNTKEDIVQLCLANRKAILLWALKGAVRLIQQGEYTIPNSMQDSFDEIKRNSDPVKGWIDEYCVVGNPLSMSLAKDLWSSFEKSPWHTGARINYQEFGRRLTKQFDKRLVGTNRVTGYYGVALIGALPNPEALFVEEAVDTL